MGHTQSNSQIRKRNMVIVDDDKSLVLGIARRLMREINVIPAISADSALKLMSKEAKIDLVASDLEMPGMDGVEFLEEVKRRHPEAKRVLFTGQIGVNKIRKAISELDFTAVMFKPLDPYELLQHARGTYR